MTDPLPTLTARLRAAGCVFAEQEAAELLAAAPDPARREQLLRRREAGEPLEQVLGQVVFGALRLSVGAGVFVPRQRSLLLARAATAAARRQREPVLLEAFAGVAPIAATVCAAIPNVEVHASDVDDRALRHAAINLGDHLALHRGDVLTPLPRSLRSRVTLLVAVPPYVPVNARDQLTREAHYEPARALFGGPDGLAHVRSLLDQVEPWLAPDGQVLVELHRDQWPAAAAHADECGLRAGRRHDGRDGQTALLCLQPAGRERLSAQRGVATHERVPHKPKDRRDGVP